MGACCCTTEASPGATPEVVLDAAEESVVVLDVQPPASPGPQQPVHPECTPSSKIFGCSLEREPGAPWGMELDLMHPYLQVAIVQAEGAVERCNSMSDVQLQADDIIISVNGVEGAPKKMLKQISDEQSSKLELRCARPQRLEVEMEREPGQAWGFDVQYQTTFTGLFVKGTIETSVAQAALCASDLILSINDVAGNPVQMKEAIKAADKLKMLVLRVDGPSA